MDLAEHDRLHKKYGKLTIIEAMREIDRLTSLCTNYREALDGLRLPLQSITKGRYTHWEKSCTAKRCIEAVETALQAEKEGKDV